MVARDHEPAQSAIAHPLRRRQSIAARELARVALRERGGEAVAIGRHAKGWPLWPAGWTGSLAHDAEHAVALIAPSALYAGLGVDVEPLLALPPDAAGLVIGAAERAQIAGLPGGDARWGRALFGAKECVHKLLNPLTGAFLEFDDVQIVFEDAGAPADQPSLPSFRVMPLSAAASAARHIVGRVWFTDATVVTAAAIAAGAV